MKKNFKLVFTFGVETEFVGNVVLVECNNVMNALDYVFNKYGNLNVCSNYHYNEQSLKNGCAYQKGLFEKIKNTYEFGKDLICRYSYKILEEIILED